MNVTRLLSLLRPAAPEIPVGPGLREALEERLGPCDPAEAAAAAQALRGALIEVVLPPAQGWLAAVAIPRAEVEAELLLLAASGFAWELGRRVGEELAAARVGALIEAGLESVGFDYRPRYAAGPAPLIHAMGRVGLGDRDPWSVAAGITGERLRVGRWRGGSEGWFRLALLAWLAGEELAGGSLSPRPDR